MAKVDHLSNYLFQLWDRCRVTCCRCYLSVLKSFVKYKTHLLLNLSLIWGLFELVFSMCMESIKIDFVQNIYLIAFDCLVSAPCTRHDSILHEIAEKQGYYCHSLNQNSSGPGHWCSLFHSSIPEKVFD